MILTAVLIAVAVGFAARWSGRFSGLINFPVRTVPTPGEIGLLDVDEVAFPIGDALTLHGWFFPVRAPGLHWCEAIGVRSHGLAQHLDRMTLQVRVGRPVDLAHAPLTDLDDDLAGADAGA
jgi:hypothetical protein